jgi:EAL domain-containing protein (putative c-di-GMP-specific phosphodiesterase class I)
MKRSDIALYEAKRSGRGRFGVFDQSMQSRLDTARTLELDMERAIREDQFEVWFQPIQDIDSRGILGYEALARWRHPSLGIVAPDNFIPVAEQNGAIVDIGKAVLEKACRAAAEWDPLLTVAVNLSAVEFRRPAELVERIKQTLHRTGLDPTRLILEITESLMLEDSPLTRAAVKQLSDYGVRFSLDDFGAGYSSLSYIQAYPFSKIKIDRKFVERIENDPVSSAIIASVCVLAERTRMEIIAEGVENRVQEIALRQLGIKHAQGFLYGRPRPILLPAPTTILRAAAGR